MANILIEEKFIPLIKEQMKN